MNRRRLLLGAVGLAACPLCAGFASQTARAAEGHGSWSYEHGHGPAAWGQLDPAYAACSAGTQQSPIDLRDAVTADLPPAAIAWRPIGLSEIVHNGHTIQVNTSGGGGMQLDGAGYDLLQFHFHHMSEHTMDGRQFPLEVHFVHKASDGQGLAVVGVFFEEGAANPVLAPIWAAMPMRKGEAAGSGTIDPAGLLPASRAAFRYAGSLTTPPCSEVVAWTVMKQPVTASAEQIGRFAKLFPNNFRPVQPLNRRFLLSTD